jgi:hypothetical protein
MNNRLLIRTWQRLRRRVGYTGIVAFALVVPLVLVTLWAMRLERDSDVLRGALARRASAPSDATSARRAVPQSEQVSEFIAGFPPLAQNAADLDEVFRSAKRHNVVLVRGEYQLKTEAGTPLVTYTATFPVRTEYAAIKDFAGDVLKALPHASLDELRMTRSDTTVGMLDSVVRLTFVYRGT